MLSKSWLVSVVLAVAAQSVVAVAEQPRLNCPDRVAVIEGNDISQRVAERIEPIYRQLGCRTRFIRTPGQRGIVDFNRGAVGGELMRISGAESEYQRPFVRSAQPVARIYTALWMHPDRQHQVDRPIGYQLGVVWQKRYASQFDNTLQMYSADELYRAYNHGDIRGFLSSYRNEQQFVTHNKLVPAPVIEKALPSYELYHYLSPEFEPLMQQISQRLEQR